MLLESLKNLIMAERIQEQDSERYQQHRFTRLLKCKNQFHFKLVFKRESTVLVELIRHKNVAYFAN